MDIHMIPKTVVICLLYLFYQWGENQVAPYFLFFK